MLSLLPVVVVVAVAVAVAVAVVVAAVVMLVVVVRWCRSLVSFVGVACWCYRL